VLFYTTLSSSASDSYPEDNFTKALLSPPSSYASIVNKTNDGINLPYALSEQQIALSELHALIIFSSFTYGTELEEQIETYCTAAGRASRSLRKLTSANTTTTEHVILSLKLLTKNLRSLAKGTWIKRWLRDPLLIELGLDQELGIEEYADMRQRCREGWRCRILAI
jgi:hypothetical protein